MVQVRKGSRDTNIEPLVPPSLQCRLRPFSQKRGQQWPIGTAVLPVPCCWRRPCAYKGYCRQGGL